jgi:hypothetical protein
MSSARWNPAVGAAARTLRAAGWRPKMIAAVLQVSQASATTLSARPPPRSRDRTRVVAITRRLVRDGWTLARIASELGLTLYELECILRPLPQWRAQDEPSVTAEQGTKENET